MSVKTPDQFFDLLAQSNALDDSRLAKAKELTKSVGNVKDVARTLIKADLLTKWQAAKLLSGKTNLMIGKYRLLGQIGGARTGTVFLAEHTQMNRRVALKALVHRDHSPESTQKFLKQARAVSSLEHPNLTRAYDIDIQDQYYYLVLEYVRGRSVEDLLSAGEKLDQHLVARYIRQAADGLEYAHGKGLLHRDIRPANIMISNDGELKVLNLGVVKLSDPADLPAADSTDASALDHAHYLSPEQARGSDNIDARSDLYSLGCVMFAMLTGTPPFDGKTFGEIVEKHQTAPPKKILDLNPGLSRDLAKICMKMLGRKREDRFQTAAQVVKFLDKWLEANAPAEPAKPPVAATAAAATAVPPVAAASQSQPPAASIKPPVSSASAAASAPGSISIAVADAPAPAAGGFAIAADPRGRRTKKKGKSKPAAAAPATDGEVAPAGGSNKTLIIGGAIGGGVLALALVIMLVFFLFSGGENEVAQVAPEEEQPAAAVDVDPAAEVAPAEVPVEPAVAPDAEPPAEVPAAAADVAAPDAAEPAPDLAALLSKPAPTPAAEDPAPAAEEPAEDPPAEEPQENPAPAATTDNAEAQPEAAPAEAAPAGSNKSKRTPQQAKEPLKELVARVELPNLAKAKGDQPAEGVGATVSLGKVFDVEDEPVFVDLLGADQIKRGSVTFEVEREHANPIDNRKWTIVLTSERPGDENRKVAEFALKDFNLNFTWLEGSLDVIADANALRNCMLLVTLGKDQEQAVALRTPQAIEPMAVSLTGKAARGQADVDSLPAKENLQIKIIKVEGFPPNTSLPPTPFPADGGTATIPVGEPGQEPLQFVIKATMSGKKPALMVSPMFKLTGMNEPEPASPAKLAEIYSSVLRVQQGANEFLKKRNNPPQEQARAEQVLADADAAFQQLNTIKSVADAMAETGKIHYQVVYAIGTHEMVIASTEAQ